MKIKYLGTGAAEGIPAIFCECDICKKARILQGKEIRTRSQAIVDDRVLLDFGPDSFWHGIKYGIDYSKIEACLITHAHDDHIYRHDIICRKKNRALLASNTPPLTIYGGVGVKAALKLNAENLVTADGNVVYNSIIPFETVKILDYHITGLPAIHKTDEPLVYAIQSEKGSLLYCHDSDILDKDTIIFMQKKKMKFDLVSLDCTEGKKDIDYQGHMNFFRDDIMRNLLCDAGIADERTVFVASHFSHNGLLNHYEAEKMAEQINFVAAYDGMEIEF